MTIHLTVGLPRMNIHELFGALCAQGLRFWLIPPDNFGMDGEDGLSKELRRELRKRKREMVAYLWGRYAERGFQAAEKLKADEQMARMVLMLEES